MSCKNCEYNLTETAQFCENCGAKVIQDRITAKKLSKDFFNDVLGWDNKYFKTIRVFFLNPEIVIKHYIDGTRKKFIAPFTFLAIGVGLITFLFNSFSDEYAEMSSSMFSESFYESMFDTTERLDKKKPGSYFTSDEYHNKYIEYRNNQMAINKKNSEITIKYFNILVLLTLPLYTYIAFLTYGRKRFNYGEHLVINSYIQGFSMISSMLFFALSFVISPYLYVFSVVITIFYYMLVYKRLCEISWGNSLVKLLKFIGILVLAILIIMIIAVVIGIIVAFITAALKA